MKRMLFCAVLVLFICNQSTSQTVSTQPQVGWYHLLEGAKTKLLDNCVDGNIQDIGYATNEVLLLFDFKGQKGYAMDIDGRIVQIQDISKIKKIDTVGRVIKLNRSINISLDSKMTENNNVWLIGFNSASGSAKVLLASGQIVEIPKDSYTDVRDELDSRWKNFKVKDVVSQ